MKLYLKNTDGGAEYYSTTFNELQNDVRIGTLAGICLRTDGDELEIMSYSQLKNAGFKSVVLPDGTRKKL